MSLTSTILILGGLAVVGYIILKPLCSGQWEHAGQPLCFFPCNIIAKQECEAARKFREENPDAPGVL